MYKYVKTLLFSILLNQLHFLVSPTFNPRVADNLKYDRISSLLVLNQLNIRGTDATI